MKAKTLSKLYSSNNYKDLKKFYSSFDSDKELLGWASKRRMKKQHIKVYNPSRTKSTNIIAIIPTTDVNGAKAKRIKELLKGIPILFNDTKGEYWSLAQSVNYTYVYAKKKFKFNWVIIANDDITVMDDIKKLQQILSATPSDVALVTVKKSLGSVAIYKPNWIRSLINPFLPKIMRDVYIISKKFNATIIPITKKRFSSFGYWKDLILYDKLTKSYQNPGDFFIINPKSLLFKDNIILDENYINECEDVDLMLRAVSNFYKTISIDFKTTSSEGGSLGAGSLRNMKSIISRTYFYKKWARL